MTSPDRLLSAIRVALDTRRELKRIKKRWLREYKSDAYVILDRMDPDFVPPSGSIDPNATVAPLAGGLGIDPEGETT